MRESNDGEAPTGRSIFDIIRSDHAVVADLFEQLEAAADEEKIHLIEKVVQELLLHTIAEEEVLYQRLRASEDLRDDVLEAEVEHSLIERLANEIMSSSPDDELCDARLMVLRELVEHHVEEEEQELLPAARSVIDAAAAESLGEEMLARKAALEAEGLEAYATDELDLDDDENNVAPSR